MIVLVNSIIAIVRAVYLTVWNWWLVLMESSGFLDVFWGIFIVFCVYRFLLRPIFGGGVGGSDKAKKSTSKDA